MNTFVVPSKTSTVAPLASVALLLQPEGRPTMVPNFSVPMPSPPARKCVSPTAVYPTVFHMPALSLVAKVGLSSSTLMVSVPVDEVLPSVTLTPTLKDSTSSAAWFG